MVLIESDWNLKVPAIAALQKVGCRINRIRLEFKAQEAVCHIYSIRRINRIRLEFKGTFRRHNLEKRDGINRIRLEFKGTHLISAE